MKKKIFSILLVLLLSMSFFTCKNSAEGSTHESASKAPNEQKLIIIDDGYLFSGDGIDLDNFDMLPTIDIAFDVAFSVLKGIYGEKECAKFYPYKGYLLNDSVWVIYGSMPRLVEGGFPYIELNRHTGCVMKVLHTK